MADIGNAARQALVQLDEAEDIVWQIKTHPTELDATFPRPEPSGDYLTMAREQEAKRQEQMAPRAEAVKDLLANLGQLWTGNLERLAHRHPAALRPLSWECVESAMQVVGNPFLGICRWGCSGCRDAVLRVLRILRSGVNRELTALGEDPAKDKDLYTLKGTLRKPIRDLLNALPGLDDDAPPRSWDEIAKRDGLNAAVVRQLSGPAQDGGLIQCDEQGVWRRLVDKPDP